MAKNEAKIKFTAETGEFNSAIKKSNDEMGELRAELKLNETQMKSTGTSVDGLKKKHDILEKQLAASQSKTEALSAKVDKASQIYGENSSEVTKLKTQLANAQTAEEKIKQSIDQCNKELKEQGDAADKAGKSTEGLNDKMKKLAVGVAAAGAALVAFGKNAIDAFNEVDEGADNVIKATGATGELAAELEQSYKNVASTMVGDFGNIGSTLGEVNTRFGFTGKQAEETTTQFLKFAEVTGMDSVSAVQAVSRAIESAGLDSSEYGNILDALTKAGQATGVSVDTLATSLTDNGAVMREMGYDTQTSIAMLAQFEKAGVDSNSVIRGMRTGLAKWAKDGKDSKKEFERLVNGIKNGSVDASEAYEAFGSKAGTELVDAIKSGRFEYQDMLAVIENSKGSLDNTFEGTIDGGYELELAMQNAKMALAEAGEEIGTALIPVFKTFSENVLPAATKAIGAMVDGISSAVSWMKEHKGATIAIATVIGVLTTAITAYNIVQGIKTAMEKANVTTVWGLVAAHWAQATAAMAAIAPYVLIVAAIAAVIAIIVVCVKYWDEITAAVKKAASACWEAIKVAWDWIKNLFVNIGEWFNTNVIQPVANFFKCLWDGIVSGCQAAWDWVKGIFTSFVGWVNNNIIQPIVNFFTGLWNGIKTVWDNICNAVQVAIMFIGSIISAAWNIITLPFRFIWENCKNIVFAAWEWIKTKVTTAINAVKTTITNVMNAIKNFFSSIWNSIKNVFTTVWNAIKSAVTTAVNAVKSVVITVWNSIKSAVTSVMNAIKNTVTKAWNAIKSVVTTVGNSIKSAVTTAWNAVKTAVTSVLNGIKSTVTSVWNGIKNTISNIVNGIKNTVTSAFNAVKSTASRVWNGVKNAIMTPINAAKDGVKSAIDKIKGFFDNLKLKFPNIKLPHFKISGKFSLDPPSVPKLKIDWYSKAVSRPMILNSPTIFGYQNGRYLGGGETKSEMIGGTNTVMQMIQSAVDRSMQAMNISALAAAVEDLANRPIELSVNGRQFALATAGDSDRVNGMRNRIIERGVLLD